MSQHWRERERDRKWNELGRRSLCLYIWSYAQCILWNIWYAKAFIQTWWDVNVSFSLSLCSLGSCFHFFLTFYATSIFAVVFYLEIFDCTSVNCRSFFCICYFEISNGVDLMNMCALHTQDFMCFHFTHIIALGDCVSFCDFLFLFNNCFAYSLMTFLLSRFSWISFQLFLDPCSLCNEVKVVTNMIFTEKNISVSFFISLFPLDFDVIFSLVVWFSSYFCTLYSMIKDAYLLLES